MINKPGDKGFVAGWQNSINASEPPITMHIEPTPKHCEYGGQVSVHVRIAGKEVLRYECRTTDEAEEYIDHLEYIGPRLNDRNVWEIVTFTDSGFQTLYLDGDGGDDCDGPQLVMSRIKVDKQERTATHVHEKVLHARNLAARYYEWWVRRGWYDDTDGSPLLVAKLGGMVEILNAILREPDIRTLDPILAKFCPHYTVEKHVQEFSHRKLEDSEE